VINNVDDVLLRHTPAVIPQVGATDRCCLCASVKMNEV